MPASHLYSLFKSAAFQLDPEVAHNQTLRFLRAFPRLASLYSIRSLSEGCEISSKEINLNWPFPVGIAAGFDKDAHLLPFFHFLGAGSLEVGTVTKSPQPGNPRPRLFRLAQQDSLRNSLGFPSQGSSAVVSRITNFRRRFPDSRLKIGINVGKQKESTEEEAITEMIELLDLFAPTADYLVINLSSPNTQGLRKMQRKEGLERICSRLKSECSAWKKVPLFLKISPDLETDQLREILEIQQKVFPILSGLVATNTTKQHSYGSGGVSGKQLKPVARKTQLFLLRQFQQGLRGECILCGGIGSPKDIEELWEKGGRFFQLYTAFIFQGPQLFKNLGPIIKTLNRSSQRGPT